MEPGGLRNLPRMQYRKQRRVDDQSLRIPDQLGFYRSMAEILSAANPATQLLSVLSRTLLPVCQRVMRAFFWPPYIEKPLLFFKGFVDKPV